jgi:hypothetical protein
VQFARRLGHAFTANAAALGRVDMGTPTLRSA